MCCCGKPTINGEQGYSWDGKTVGVYSVSAPTLDEGEVVIWDEPGRCGGLDSHSYHFRVVANKGRLESIDLDYRTYYLLVRHGGGQERIRLGGRPGIDSLSGLNSNNRYWILQMMYHCCKDSENMGQTTERNKWQQAAAEKRIKTRKMPKSDTVKVWIEPTVK